LEHTQDIYALMLISYYSIILPALPRTRSTHYVVS